MLSRSGQLIPGNISNTLAFTVTEVKVWGIKIKLTLNKSEINTYVWEHLQLGSNVHVNESYFRVEWTLDIK